MVVSGTSIAHWLTFGIESNVVFNTFVYAPRACSFYLFSWPEGGRPKRRSDRIAAMPSVPVSVELSGSPMATFLANIRPVHGKGPMGQGMVMQEQSEANSIVFVVDDDNSLREALKSLLRSVGLRVETFGSAADFLTHKFQDDGAACLVLDVRLPGLSGLDFQAELAKAGIQIPIIFISGHGDIPMTVRAMKAGAIEFLTKPFRDQDLLDAVQIALERDRRRRTQDKAVHEVRAHFEALTPREQEVIGLVTAGLMNKQIAAELGVSEITVKVHRGNVMKKMGARSLADLVRMADTLGIRRSKA
jgi:FixJ family two-component response regulator